MVCFVLMFLSLVVISHMAPAPSEQPSHPRVSEKQSPTGRSKPLVSIARKVVAKWLVAAGAALDPEAVVEATAKKGYIKKALDRSRQELKEQVDQQAELQHFFENQILTLTTRLESDEATLHEVLGDDFDSSKATAKSIASKVSLTW